MNKGGVGLGGGAGGGGGPTAAAAAAAAQKQKSLLQRVDTDVGNLVDNFGYIVNVARNWFNSLLRANRTSNLAKGTYRVKRAILTANQADISLASIVGVNDPPVRNSQESFMMEMRAARMVQASESLLKLVSELKQTAIFSGFASLNDHVDQRTDEFNKLAENTNTILARIGEETAASLKELESHYYSSALRMSIPREP